MTDDNRRPGLDNPVGMGCALLIVACGAVILVAVTWVIVRWAL